mmetsp:Transcript_2765/g.4336  ORF Transcript_2765/g.4336 Transcript_2765/m.4336 type:complete len:216 (-) Transcript_2765:907-1554(-)
MTSARLRILSHWTANSDIIQVSQSFKTRCCASKASSVTAHRRAGFQKMGISLSCFFPFFSLTNPSSSTRFVVLFLTPLFDASFRWSIKSFSSSSSTSSTFSSFFVSSTLSLSRSSSTSSSLCPLHTKGPSRTSKGEAVQWKWKSRCCFLIFFATRNSSSLTLRSRLTEIKCRLCSNLFLARSAAASRYNFWLSAWTRASTFSVRRRRRCAASLSL